MYQIPREGRQGMPKDDVRFRRNIVGYASFNLHGSSFSYQKIINLCKFTASIFCTMPRLFNLGRGISSLLFPFICCYYFYYCCYISYYIIIVLFTLLFIIIIVVAIEVKSERRAVAFCFRLRQQRMAPSVAARSAKVSMRRYTCVPVCQKGG